MTAQEALNIMSDNYLSLIEVFVDIDSMTNEDYEELVSRVEDALASA